MTSEVSGAASFEACVEACNAVKTTILADLELLKKKVDAAHETPNLPRTSLG